MLQVVFFGKLPTNLLHWTFSMLMVHLAGTMKCKPVDSITSVANSAKACDAASNAMNRLCCIAFAEGNASSARLASTANGREGARSVCAAPVRMRMVPEHKQKQAVMTTFPHTTLKS